MFLYLPNFISFPNDLLLATNFILDIGNFLLSNISIISLPTLPVAPTITTLYPDVFIFNIKITKFYISIKILFLHIDYCKF